MTITLTRKEAQQVLDSLEWFERRELYLGAKIVTEPIQILRAALAQPEQNVSYAGNGTASNENTTTPTGFFFQMPRLEPEECYSCGSIHSAYVRHCAKCGYMKGLENPEWTNKGKLRNVTIVFKDVPSYTISRCSKDFDVYMDGKKVDIYIAPPKKEWVGMTEDQRKQIIIDCEKTGDWGWEIDACKKIEAKLKEKNT